jgi:hypothetical protein
MSIADGLSNLSNGVQASPQGWKPAVEFDGENGTATTPGLLDQPDFNAYLIEAGFDPALIEIVGNPRTSRWQRYDGEWLTSWRFSFRQRIAPAVDLPLLYSLAKKSRPAKRAEKALKPKALVILWADLQVGKVDTLGGIEALLERTALMRERLVEVVKREKVSQIVFCDVGDTIENFGNAANLQQLRMNDLSLMEQVDVATSEAWLTLKTLSDLVPDVVYAAVGSNHCQWRVSKQAVGRPGVDDWGIFITKQVQRLARERGFDWRFFVPEPENESVTLDVMGHKLALAHGHQASRPEGVVGWWRGQQFGNQPAAHADILCTGHFHHLRVQETGAKPEGGSRFWIQAATLDNGSGWFRRTSGESAVPGLVCFVLEESVDFTGTVFKL